MKHKFFFVTGSPGSGVTMVANVLSRVDGVLGIGEHGAAFDHFLLDKFAQVSKLAWHRETAFDLHDYHIGAAKAHLERIANMEDMLDYGNVLFARSPMDDDGYRPDICDMRAAYPGVKVVAVYRNPMGATNSAFRNGFGRSLRHCAIRQEEQLTTISAQISQIPPEDRLVLSYDSMCENVRNEIEKLSSFCGLPADAILGAAEAEGIDSSRKDAWKSELGAKSLERLMEFFSYRSAQWAPLTAWARR